MGEKILRRDVPILLKQLVKLQMFLLVPAADQEYMNSANLRRVSDQTCTKTKAFLRLVYYVCRSE